MPCPLTDPGRVHLDAYARRHEGQKIYLRQAAAQRWIDWRDQVLQGSRPTSKTRSQLEACDYQLRMVDTPVETAWNPELTPKQELALITDEYVYTELQASDLTMGRWTAEDPSLRAVQRWLRARR